MLCVEQVSSKPAGDREGHEDRQDIRGPSEKIKCKHNARYVQDQGDNRIVMSAWTGHKRKDTHSKAEQGKIPEDHVKGMSHGKILPTLTFCGSQEFLLGKNGVRTYARAEKFGVVVVMVIVRAFPDARRCEHVQSEGRKNDPCREGFIQDRMMRIIVVDHEHARYHQPGHDAGKYPECRMQVLLKGSVMEQDKKG